MALIVEDGSGMEDADSYVSIQEADDYAPLIGDPHEWLPRPDADKEVALRLATTFIDRQFGARLSGMRGSKEQALEWPRTDACYTDGWSIDSDEIPDEVKRATMLSSFRIANGEDLEPDPSVDGAIKRTRQKVGPLEDEVEYVGAATGVAPIPKEIKNTLRRVLAPVGNTDRG